MSSAHASGKDIRELQRLAQEAPLRPASRRKRPSRAARLAAVDLLSRWSAAGLALFAGIGVYLSITVGRIYPTRAAAWALMLLAALWVCRRLQADFRAGAAMAARPFRWRASYISCLCVLGVAFASAPILLVPSTAPTALALQISLLTLVGAFGAALVFSAHANSAAAAAIPGATFPVLAAWRNGDLSAAGFIAVAVLIAFGVIAGLHAAISRKLADRHPRTALLRAEISAQGETRRIDAADRQRA